MSKQTEEKIEKEVKQIGLDVAIGMMIVALIIGACLGVWIAL